MSIPVNDRFAHKHQRTNQEPNRRRNVAFEHQQRNNSVANRDILAIGASAGGVEALVFLAQNFPRDFPATVLVTMHISTESGSVLDEVLDRAGPLHATFAGEYERLRKGHIFIAPVDRHLIIEGERLVLGRGARENNSRPAIDPMLRSVAVCCGPRTVGAILTGTLNDGASGLWAVNQCGGITVVQDPHDAEFSEMPMNALSRVEPDHVVSLAAMPRLLTSLASEPAGDIMPIPATLEFETNIAKGENSTIDEMDRIGRRSGLSCPDCHGAMWEIDEGDLTRFRCHVGHTYVAERFSLALDENLRRALGSALRALEERRSLTRRLEKQADQNHQRHLAISWARKARELEQELETVRSSIARLDEIVRQAEAYRAAE